MNSFQKGYAYYYNAIHAQKDYSAEAKKISNFIDTEFSKNDFVDVLDFGCGTGKHLHELSLITSRLRLFGYDKSDFMVSEAKNNFPNLVFSTELNDLTSAFDLVYSLFDVINYQVTNQEVITFLSNMNKKCKIGGYIILDSWNYTAIMNDPPGNRTREFKCDGNDFARLVEVSTESDYRITEIDISIIESVDKSLVLTERHSIRAFETEELRELVIASGFENIQFFSSENWKKPLASNDWRFFMKATKK
jgi:SAM-dependent methyltransferase